jgi:ABC-type nitrate/sulfonate/bicarbonate transport system ATPase subunit
LRPIRCRPACCSFPSQSCRFFLPRRRSRRRTRDEPFGALDALTREQLQHELLQIWQRTGVTIIFVTHSVEEAVVLADRVLVMSAGPGRIDSDFRIELARPRDVSSPEFNALRSDVARRLTSHLALVRA